MSAPFDRLGPGSRAESSDPTATGRAASGIDAVAGLLRRRWRLIAVCILVVAGVAVAYSLKQDKRYSTTASVLFQQDADAFDTGNDFSDPQRVAATNEELLALPAVAQLAAKELGVSEDEVTSTVSIDSSKESDIVEIKASSGDPRRAARIANAYGRAFIEFRRSGARQRIDEALAGAQRALSGLSDVERASQAGIDLRDRINSLQTSRSLQTGGADLVSSAVVPESASSPKPVRSGILGVILGALVGLGVAALRERRDDRVTDADDLEALFGRPVIAQIPRSRVLAMEGLVPLYGEEAEAFRMLRTNLRYFSVDVELRSLLVASSQSGEGKSTVARRLAETSAIMGDSVVLVEADLHRLSQFEPAGAAEDVGLSTVLIGGSLEEALADFPVGDAAGEGEDRLLTVLRTGPPPPNPSELLDSERMRDVLLELQARFGMVIVDSPPLPVVSDALPLVNQLDGVLAVGAAGMTSRSGIRDLLRLLTLHSGNLLGVVENFGSGGDRQSSAYYRDPRAGRKAASPSSGELSGSSKRT